ncbi:hypothetical protein P3S67_000884 [Capsicum chacoense]
MNAINSTFRGYKCRFKKEQYYASPNDEIQMAKRPKTVPEPVSADILQYWNSKEAKDKSDANKQNQKIWKYPHTVGEKSFALIREEKRKENSGAVSNKEFLVDTRRRKSGRVCNDSSEDITNQIVEMERVETQESEDGSQLVDPFTTVMGPDHPGRVRLYGRGVTKSLLKQKASDSRHSNIAVDELRENRMDELEERIQQRMQAQSDAIERDVTMNFITQLQHQNPRLTLDPNMLRFNAHSSREEAVIQQINRPFIRNNNEECSK